MSKPVRIRGDVAWRVEVLASSEQRSFANMVEVLLLAALTEREPERGGGSSGVSRSASGATPGPSSPRSVSADRPAKPYPKPGSS